MENPIVYSPVDAGKIISDTAANLMKSAATSGWAKVKKYFKDFSAEESIEIGTAFNDYIRVTQERNSKIKTLIYRRVPKDIYSFYECVGLRLEGKVIKTSNVSDVLKIGKKILVTGTGGIGKSILMKHLFLNTIKDTEYIPVLLELRKFNGMENKDISIYRAIYQTLSDNGFALADEYYKYSLEKGGYIILLDGFDEVNRDKLKKVQEEIKSFSDKFEKNTYIISSRPTEMFIGWNDFVETSVMPLSKKQALSLVNKIEFDESAKRAFYTELSRTLYDKYTSFASNPLLLTIMLLTFSNHASIPENLNEFYEEAFTTLFNMHDATKDCYLRDIRTGLGCEEFKTVFSYICFKSYFRGQFEFTEHQLRERIQEAQSRFPLYKFTIEDFQEDLTLSVCMLVKDGLSYRFSHRSFQEYFAALYTCKLTDDVQSKLLATWFDESISVVGDEYMAMLYNLQPDKVNKIVLCPGLKKLKELYDSIGFSVELLKELFSGVHLRRLYKLENSKRVTDYTIDFDISNRYLCNILMITCKLNHFFNPNAEGIKKTREIASTWVSEREKQDPQNRYRIEPIEFDDLMIFLDEHNFTVADFLEACKWIEARFIFSFKILEKYSENSISRKKKVSSILDEL